MQKAAIVILNYNGVAQLRKFIPSVVSFSSFDIVVIDNASTDASLDFLRKNFPQIKLEQLPENLGFAGGYTKGLGNLRGRYEYYILLNSDVEVTPLWDSELITWLENNPEVVAVQPKILKYDQKDFFEHAGAAGGFLDELGYPFCRGRIFETLESDKGQYEEDIRVDWTSGACMAVRSEMFHLFGGFDPLFFSHMEEIDLCWRWRNHGYPLYCLPKVQVFHVGGATLSPTHPRKTFLNFRNSLFLLRKNLDKWEYRKIYLKRILLDLLAAFVFLLRGLPSHSKAVIKAHIGFHKFKNKLHNSGKKSKKIGTMGVSSILWEYYLLGKKKFSEI
ncbi:glycosyltransferase family 2 protein [Arthrospiribacter ruber]|uniref:Glycosyltransferase family 2 protein n=1 Tax=Arthrospiribacter ruber TaxID=2487934 RepID=A0A951IYZ7_9BACT|nr:glycosyltransferase family 2 protein [Arthrospiribacter ruber]MBW3469730.1 glycosyltransferase family 2 protein [Arthrospiribacter ruber]